MVRKEMMKKENRRITLRIAAGVIGIMLSAAVLAAFDNLGGIQGLSGAQQLFIPQNSQSVFYNPALLADINRADITLSSIAQYNIGLSTNSVTAVYPFYSYNIFLGAGAFIQSYNDEEDDFKYGSSIYKFALATKVSRLYLGAALKFFTQSFSAYGINYGKGTAPSFDFAAMYKRGKNRVTISIKDPLGIEPNYNDAVTAKARNANVSLGLFRQIMPSAAAMLSFNLAGEASAAMRYSFNKIDFYGGADWYIKDKLVMPNLGAAIDFKYFVVSYGAAYHPYLGLQNNVSVSYNFAYKKDPVVIDKVEMSDIVPSMQLLTGSHWGKVYIKSRVKHPISGKLRITVEGTKISSVETFVLGAEQVKSIPIILHFPEQIFYLPSDKFYTLKTTISTVIDDKQYENSTTSSFIVYSRNAFIWSNVARLSSFVLPNSKNIEQVAGFIKKELGVTPRQPLKYIAAGFDLLGEMGVTYINDPINPFEKLSEVKGVIDNIQLPFETLKRGAGDCDDDVILLVSLYEHGGLNTYFADMPGHIMLLVQTKQKSKAGLGRFAQYAIKIGDEYFIPIEATKIGLSIYDSVEDAYNTYMKEQKKGVLRIYNVKDALKKYRRSFDMEPKLDLTYPSDLNKIKEDLRYVD